jgi:hypothetical protein
MFGLFKKKNNPDEITVTDKVVIDEQAKLAVLLHAWQQAPQSVIVCWFEDSLDKISAYMNENSREPVPVLLMRDALTAQRGGRSPIFAEHYPLRSKEVTAYQAMQIEKAVVYSSLREPLFRQFGGDKIIHIMQQLGMKDTELIEHSMISNSIKKAQEKIEQKTTLDQSARSQEEWIEKNYHP